MKSIELSPFINDMAEAYRWADLVICRSGAMTVSELAVAGLPAIFIPYPFAIDDHQTANAEWMVAANAAKILQQADMSLAALSSLLTDLNEDRMSLSHMRAKACSLGIHDATENVVLCCMELVDE